MSGELPFEMPLAEMRKKIDELKQFGQEKGSISRMKSPAWKNDIVAWRKKSILRFRLLRKCIWPVISADRRRLI